MIARHLANIAFGDKTHFKFSDSFVPPAEIFATEDDDGNDEEDDESVTSESISSKSKTLTKRQKHRQKYLRSVFTDGFETDSS